MASKQCQATVKTPDYENFGKQCQRLAVTGADYCERHGGVEQASDRDAIRTRLDRPRQRCSATTSAGNPCKKWAIHGATVCRTHGGNLPNVREAARKRIEAMILPAWDELRRIMLKDSTSDADKIRAITVLLDRGGYGPRSELGVTAEVKPWEGLVAGVLKSSEDIVDAEVIEYDDDPRPPLPSDEEVQARMAEYLAERQITLPKPDPEPVPENVVTFPTSRKNPPAHLR